MASTITNAPTREDLLLTAFLSSSWFAEDEAAPVVDKLLAHPCDDDEREVLSSYAAEETLHGRLIAEHFARRGLAKGQPFWIQALFRQFRARLTLLVQFYYVETLAGTFYGAMAGRVKDADARVLLRRLLLDEARHIRLHRELLAREIARRGLGGRLRARLLLALFRWSSFFTVWYQSNQLAPILGEAAPRLRAKIRRNLAADRPRLLAGPGRTRADLNWWWRR